MRRLLPGIAFLTLVLAVGCARSFQAFDVSRLNTNERLSRDSLFYTLPRTVVVVDVPITRIDTSIDGARCAAAAFGSARAELALDDPKAGTAFKIGKPVVSTRSEPDPTAVYAIDLTHRPFVHTGGTFEQSDNSLLTTATLTVEDESLDAALSVAKIALGAGGVIAPLAAKQPSPDANKDSAARTPCAAIEAQIRAIRDQRTRALSQAVTGQGITKDLLDEVMTQFDAAEAPLVAQFSGATTPTIVNAHCEFRLNKGDDASHVVLFNFNKQSGVSNVNQACDVSMVVRPSNPTPDKDVVLRVEPDGPQFSDVVSNRQRQVDSDARGFFYRIPANASVSVTVGPNVAVRQVTQIAQFGVVNALPAVGGAFVKKAEMTPTLNASGGLSKLVLNSEPNAKDAISGAGDLFTSIQKTEAAKKTAAADAKDELKQLTRKREILEEQKKIADLEAALAQSAGSTP